MKLPIPRQLERRLKPFIEKGEAFLREWEWTWARAFVAAIGISFFAITTLGVIPSWFLNFADETLEWRERWPWLTLRDVLVSGWITVWIGFFVITAYKVQVIRKRVRGEKQSDRYSGGYR